MKDYYKIMEVDPEASLEVMNQAYRALAKKYHPDQYHLSTLKLKMNEKMQEVNEAYSILSSAEKRAKYDRTYKVNLAARTKGLVRDGQVTKLKTILFFFALVIFLTVMLETVGKLVAMTPYGKLIFLAVMGFVVYRVLKQRNNSNHHRTLLS